jgi:hypothetical protein
MERARFDEYIRRFNERDPTAFDEFITRDMEMLNGALRFTGSAGMRDHYENKIWPFFEERLNVLRFVSDETVLAVQLWTEFIAHDKADTLFGPVEKGERFDYRGLIMYDIDATGRFTTITVSYNSFTNTKLDGNVIELGMPH